jgi:hypothetical protein
VRALRMMAALRRWPLQLGYGVYNIVHSDDS